MFELKPYEETDEKVYLDLQQATYEKYVIEFFGVFDIAVTKKHLQILKPHLYKIIFENKLAGFIYFCEEEQKITLDVFTLFPEFRNKGLGSNVMSSFIELSNKTNKPIFLDTFKTNPAKRFYERHGFEVVDENMSHYILKYDYKNWFFY